MVIFVMEKDDEILISSSSRFFSLDDIYKGDKSAIFTRKNEYQKSS